MNHIGNFVKRATEIVLRQIAPGFHAILKARRARAHSQMLEKQWGLAALTKKLIEHNGVAVDRGPFRGMMYIPQTFERHLAPKLLGTYEKELHPVWTSVFQKNYEQILDVGCAEGYFAVGLARHFPSVPIHAFDIDSWARKVTQRMAAANNAENVCVHRACNVEWLVQHLRPGAFVLSDCEGFEDQLFRPKAVSAMASCDLLIELHEEAAFGVTERLIERFSRTHEQRLISKQKRRLTDLPSVPFLTEEEQRLALREYRSGSQQWLYLEAKPQ